MKGYNIWNLETNNIVYSRDVVFREVKDVPKYEFLLGEEEPEKIEFELEGEKSDSTKEHESKEEEPHTLVLRRSIRERKQP